MLLHLEPLFLFPRPQFPSYLFPINESLIFQTASALYRSFQTLYFAPSAIAIRATASKQNNSISLPFPSKASKLSSTSPLLSLPLSPFSTAFRPQFSVIRLTPTPPRGTLSNLRCNLHPLFYTIHQIRVSRRPCSTTPLLLQQSRHKNRLLAAACLLRSSVTLSHSVARSVALSLTLGAGPFSRISHHLGKPTNINHLSTFPSFQSILCLSHFILDQPPSSPEPSIPLATQQAQKSTNIFILCVYFASGLFSSSFLVLFLVLGLALLHPQSLDNLQPDRLP